MTNGQSLEQQMGRILEEHAAGVVPDDLDLWPAIAAQVRDRQRLSGWVRRGRRVHFPWTLRRSVLVPVAAILLLALLLGPGLTWNTPEGSTIEFFNSMARVAAAQPVESISPIEGYYYQRTESAYLGQFGGAAKVSKVTIVDGRQVVEQVDAPKMEEFSVLVPKTREFWMALDDPGQMRWGRIRETAGEPIFLGERDRARWEAAGSPNVIFPINTDIGPGPLPYAEIRRLPPDAKALAAAIRKQASRPGGPPVDEEMFVIVGDLLREPDLSPAMRAALFEVAGEIKGAELVGKVTDRAGRPGVAVSRTTSDWGPKQRDTLIFDPTTSRLLAEERVLLERADYVDATPPAVIGYALYLESGIVSSVPGGPPSPEPTPGMWMTPMPADGR